MPIGDPGKEQFRRAIVSCRNLYVAAGIQPLMLMRQELLGNDDLTDRGGMDSTTQKQANCWENIWPNCITEMLVW